MDELRIDSREQLADWLATHHGFPDLFVLRMEPRPLTSGAPSMPHVTIELATQSDGGFEAGESRTLRVFELRADDVRTYWIEDPKGYDSSFCNDTGIRQLDIDRPGMQLEVPSRVQLVCGSMTVRELADRTEIIQPWIDDRELAALVRGHGLPSPSDIVELFEQEGVTVVWRRFGEGPREAGSVAADYSGWYVQQPERFAREEAGGVFFFAVADRGDGFMMHVQNHDPANAALWRALRAMLLHYRDIEIRTGNCRLDAKQWQQYLKEGYTT